MVVKPIDQARGGDCVRRENIDALFNFHKGRKNSSDSIVEN